MIEDSVATKGGSSSSGRRQKGKRSLFSVLFQSSKSSKLQADEDKDNSKGEPKDDKMTSNSNININSLDGDRSETEQKRRPEVEDKEEEEEDSYELDLDKRLEREKFRRSQRIQSAPPTRQTPEGGSWCNNGNYIPRGGQSGRSPLLEQFLSSHQIQFDSIDFSSSEDEMERRQQSCQQLARPSGKKTNSSSEADSLAERVARMMSGAGKTKLEAVQQQQQQRKLRKSVDERDLRLVQWRLLASRTACSTSSLPSSDSELDLLDCQRPALAIACSDDTSCSSVELIWTRGSCNQATETTTTNSSNPPHQNDRFAQISSLLEPEARKLFGLNRENGHPGALAGYPRDRRSAEPADKISSKQQAATNSDQVSSAAGLHRTFAQRLSIFELAKPSRAKDKRLGVAVVVDEKRKRKNGTTPVEQWVANPLFSESDEQTLDRAPDIRCASCESVIIGSKSNDRRMRDSLLVSTDDDNDSAKDFGRHGEGKLIRKRWSMRGGGGRSPFNVSNHLMNLDRRIKSNVSSLRSQLSVRISDTSKRASILADQLISSIKDTTKEQLFSGGGTMDDDSMLSNSFATDTGEPNGKEPASTEKAKLFSLIYKHQQQSNGQPVITRQPMATGAMSSISPDHHHNSLDKSQLSSIELAPHPSEPPVRPEEEQEVETKADEVLAETLELDRGQSESSSDMELLSLSRAGDDDDDDENLDGQLSPKTSELMMKALPDQPENGTCNDKKTPVRVDQEELTKQLEPTTSSNYNSIILSSGSSSNSTSEAIFHSDAFVGDATSSNKDNAGPHQSQVVNDSATSAKEAEKFQGKAVAGTGKRRWRRRRQINVAMVSSDEDKNGHDDDDDVKEAKFYEKELNKLTSESDNSSQRQRPHRLRSLNYWRRLRSRVSKPSINGTKLDHANQSDL